MECTCCYNDECLDEDMLPCRGGHLFCRECVQRASEVAIGEGKVDLTCLGQCEEVFELSTLQKALKPNTFAKWLSRIQLAEIEKAEIDGLEQCPFCPFATIIDTRPEEDKVFRCQNPDCSKDSCRLCKEPSHIPLRCEEVEKDAEVRKRTYIENKMTEAMIRNCWKCKKPFVKMDGCNKMTCDCGASMCYLCRKPVRDYKHFVGQGGHPQPGQTCPLWSDNASIHESDVARGALEAKNEMDKQNPNVQLKHDPAKDINIDRARRQGGGHDPYALLREQQVPQALVGILPEDPMERQRLIREQERIENMIRHGRNAAAGALFAAPANFWGAAAAPNFRLGGAGGPVMPPLPVHALHQNVNQQQLRQHLDWQDGFARRMGELLQLREVQRQRNRVIRRRELQALEEIRRRENVAHPAPAAAAGANPAAAPGAPPPGPAGAAAAPQPPQQPQQQQQGGPIGPHAAPAPVLLPAAGQGRHYIDHHYGYQQQIQRQLNPMPAHLVQPAAPIPPPPPAHVGGRDHVPPRAHQAQPVLNAPPPPAGGGQPQPPQQPRRPHWYQQQMYVGPRPVGGAGGAGAGGAAGENAAAAARNQNYILHMQIRGRGGPGPVDNVPVGQQRVGVMMATGPVIRPVGIEQNAAPGQIIPLPPQNRGPGQQQQQPQQPRQQQAQQQQQQQPTRQRHRHQMADEWNHRRLREVPERQAAASRRSNEHQAPAGTPPQPRQQQQQQQQQQPGRGGGAPAPPPNTPSREERRQRRERAREELLQQRDAARAGQQQPQHPQPMQPGQPRRLPGHRTGAARRPRVNPEEPLILEDDLFLGMDHLLDF